LSSKNFQKKVLVKSVEI